MTVKISSAALTTVCLLSLARAASAGDINVGPTRSLHTLAAAVANARPGDRVLLDEGTYLDDFASINVPIVIEGAGTGATLSITRPISNRKGILIVNANLTVRNITFQGAQVSPSDGGNGAGIRMQAGALTVENCAFVDNQNGILANPDINATIAISGSRFSGNGAGDGYTHAIYSNEIARLTVTGSTFSGTKAGHNIKSRALQTVVTQTVIDDGVTGSSSYAIDLSNGGIAVIDNVTVTQGPNTTNPAMIAYGAEGNLKATNSLTVSNSSFANRHKSPSVLAVNNFTNVSAVLTNDTFIDIANPLRGAGSISLAPIVNVGGSTSTGSPSSTGGPATSGPSPNVPPSPSVPPSTDDSSSTSLHQTTIFSTGQSNTDSYLRFYNTGASAGAVTVDLFNGATGERVARWKSPGIAANATLQISVRAIEATGDVRTKPQFYTVGVTSEINGTFQHVLYRPWEGVLANLTNCDTGLTANTGKLPSVHSSVLNNRHPSTINFYNTGSAPASPVLQIFNAATGARLGTYTTAAVAPGTLATIPVGLIEAGAGIAPSGSMQEYNIRLEYAFTGIVQHLVNNSSDGSVADMTLACALK